MGISLFFVVFFATLLLGIPIGVAVGITCLSGPLIFSELLIDAQYVFRNVVSSIDSYPLLAMPLFVLSGNIMARGGISKKLFDFFSYFVGKRTGGLPGAVVVTCLFYGAISGSSPATTAAVGAMTIPLLVELGYDKVFVTAIVATAGSLGIIIPPSIPMIVYGTVSGESVGNLFTAGIFPGIIVALSLIIYVWLYCKIKGEDKEKLQANYDKLHENGFGGMFKESFWALLTPVIILGGIYSGIVTPTEAANVSVIYALIISLAVYKTLKLKDIPEIMRETLRTVAPIMLVVSTATVFGRVLTMMGIPNMVADLMSSTFTSKTTLMLAVIGILIVVGMIMEPLSAVLILTPIFLPLLKAYDVSVLHFGVIMVVDLAIGFVTPPVGMNLYIASGMTGIPVLKIAKKALPLLLVFGGALLLIAFIPQISLALVS